MLKAVALVFLFAASVALWWFGFADPLTKTAILQPEGTNATPAYFTVPSNMKSATEKLSRLGLQLYSIEESDHCLAYRFERKVPVYVFADDSWRQGTLCIVPKGEDVGHISWRFQPGAP